LGRGESCESVYVRDSSVHQKCSNHALTNSLFGLCKFMWIINPLVTRPSPHPEAPTHPSTPEVLRATECTPTPPFVVFTFKVTFEYFEECGGASLPPSYGPLRWLIKIATCLNQIDVMVIGQYFTSDYWSFLTFNFFFVMDPWNDHYFLVFDYIMHWGDWIFSFIKCFVSWYNCLNSKLECKFMIGLSQGLGNGCTGLFVKNIDLNGDDGNV
jgi:hypothetical protein